jgi:hypothetical protein
MNSPPQQIISDQEWSVWINNWKITGDTLNIVGKHIQETAMSEWLAAPRKHGSEPRLNLTQQQLINPTAIIDSWKDKNESEIYTSWKEYAQWGSGPTVNVLDATRTTKMKCTFSLAHTKNVRIFAQKPYKCYNDYSRCARQSPFYGTLSPRKYNNCRHRRHERSRCQSVLPSDPPSRKRKEERQTTQIFISIAR